MKIQEYIHEDANRKLYITENSPIEIQEKLATKNLTPPRLELRTLSFGAQSSTPTLPLLC
jgi:hypothetical protein